MELNEFLEGEALTGRQAAIVFITFLILIVVAGLILVTFSDVFYNLVN